MIEVAGITEDMAKQIRSIELLNASTSGGARVYDMYVRVPDTSVTGIEILKATAFRPMGTTKVLEQGRLVIVRNGDRYRVTGQKM